MIETVNFLIMIEYAAAQCPPIWLKAMNKINTIKMILSTLF